MTGMNGIAVLRAADAMLRSLGGEEIQLLLPLMGMPDDSSAQLGLVDPGVQQLAIAPVVVRNLPTSNNGPRRRLEFLLSASVIEREATDQNAASAAALLESALGLVHDGEVLHIEGYSTEYFGGVAYLYRVVAVD